MNRLNRNELLTGAVFGLSFFWLIGFWFALIFSGFSAYLWALTGAGESKLFRRLLVPLGIGILAVLNNVSWLILLAVPVSYSALSIGYGIPSEQPKDDGSTLGAFFFKLTKGNTELSDILTRGAILVLAVAPFAILKAIF